MKLRASTLVALSLALSLAACGDDDKKGKPAPSEGVGEFSGFTDTESVPEDQIPQVRQEMERSACKTTGILPSDVREGMTSLVIETTVSEEGGSRLRRRETMKSVSESEFVVSSVVLESSVSHPLYSGPLYTDAPAEGGCRRTTVDGGVRTNCTGPEHEYVPALKKLIVELSRNPDAWKQCETEAQLNESQRSARRGTFLGVDGVLRAALVEESSYKAHEICRKGGKVVSDRDVIERSSRLIVKGAILFDTGSSPCAVPVKSEYVTTTVDGRILSRSRQERSQYPTSNEGVQ